MDKPSINIVVIGEVGSGKSTTAAHLIHKLGGIHQRLVKRFEKEASQMRMSRDSLKYSWVLDKLESEKERGISIDNTIGRFETDYYYCTVIDAPGHPSSIKDTITAISHADAALLIIDSTSSDFRAGINSQTFEHALLAYGLGVKNIIPCCNKIDDTGYSQERYNAIVGELSSCLKESGYMDEFVFVPMSGLRGDNLFESSTELGWHNGLTLLEAIDRITEPSRPVNNPLRVPIQQFHKIFGIGTVAVGRVQAGELKRGMEVTVGPIGLAMTVKSIEMHGYDLDVAFPGDNIKFNLGNIPIKDLEQGHVVSDSNFVPAMEALSFTATVMMKKCIKPITKGYTATMHCNMFYGTVKLDDLISIIDSLTGDVIENRPKSLKNGEVGIVKMIPTKRRRMVVETYSDCPPLGRFVLRDTHNTIAIGLIKSVEKKDQSTELNMHPRTPEKLSATIDQQERSSTLAVPSTSSAIEKLPTNSTTRRRIPLSLMPLEKEYDIQFQQEQEASAVHDYPSASSNIQLLQITTGRNESAHFLQGFGRNSLSGNKDNYSTNTWHSHVHEDLLTLVLVRLPVNSLGRFKCVSKSWNTLISSRGFIKLHLHQSRIDQNPSFLVWRDFLDNQGRRNSLQIYAVEFLMDSDCRFEQLHDPIKSSAWTCYKDIVGCCNGLLCVMFRSSLVLSCDDVYAICLWNPLTKSIWSLPLAPYVDHQKKKDIGFYGFGYDYVSDDYKVVIASCLNNPVEFGYVYEVYSLRSDSWSQEISYINSGSGIHANKAYGEQGVSVNGALHWLYSSYDHQRRIWRNSILAIDLRTDKHRLLPVPEVLDRIQLQLVVLNGCLLLIDGLSLVDDRRFDLNYDYKFDMWMMKDYGSKDSWTKIISIHNMPNDMGEYTIPLALSESSRGQSIRFYSKLSGGGIILLLYEVVDNHVVERSITGSMSGRFKGMRHHFVGSLVQPQPLNPGKEHCKKLRGNLPAMDMHDLVSSRGVVETLAKTKKRTHDER